jgi:hypothetical protein
MPQKMALEGHVAEVTDKQAIDLPIPSHET